jgi:outer membrane protein OmpA-like peptidoglycan-associated protein
MRKKIIALCLILSLVLMGTGCAEWSRMQKGAAVGAGTGAVAGGLIGHAAGNTAVGILLGAAIGGAAGAYIGNYMDKQAAEIERDIAGARVERVGEGIKITFSSGVMFDVNKAVLKDQYRGELSELAAILNKYEDTNILLEGHTDSTGTEEYNLDLSKKRSQSVANYLATQNVTVANYLATQNVTPTRFTIMGYGESQPIVSNETSEGRAQNRRAEVAIYANEKLKKVAKEKTS